MSDADYEPLSVTKNGVVPRLDNVALTNATDNRKLVRRGDFVINSRSDRKGSSGISSLDGSVSVVYTVLTPRSVISGRYAHQVLRSTAFQEEFYRWGSGIVADLWSTRYSAMKSISIPVPPLPEQEAIANYLDRETAQIDTLIAKQEQLIGTLRERLTSQIAHSLSPSSGTSKLDEESEAWPEVQLGFVANTLPGWAFPSDGFSVDRTQTRLLRGVNVRPRSADWTDTVYWDEEANPVPDDYQLREGDIVLGMDRPFVSGGVRVATLRRSDVPALLLQRVLRIRPLGKLNREFIQYVMMTDSFLHYLTPMFTGVSVPHISEWQVSKFRIPLPPLPQQERIVRELQDATAKTRELMTKAERFIELSKERRATLITAAVTGQLEIPA